MFLSKNDLPSLKAYFNRELTSFSTTELHIMVKQLVMQRLNWTEVDFMLNKDVLFSESDLLFFRDVVKRLQKNEPFQHIVGEVEFYGLNLKSDARALIPRPETEELVDWIVFDNVKKTSCKILDLCAGTGCVSLALKSSIKEAEVEAVEWSSQAFDLMQDNIQRTNLDIKSRKFDVLNEESYSELQKEFYDVWVSNPPYIPFEDKVRMKENVLEYEPEMALFVENDVPFVFYEKIANKAQDYLKEKGFLYFEIHEDFAQDVLQILKRFNFVNIEIRKDLQGKDRMIKAQKVSSQHESERS